ncbi:MAG: hypothetical protein FWD76_02615 [Firmicutes bacterium]|nr:hypothetical protein [Bacillota bacterium]
MPDWFKNTLFIAAAVVVVAALAVGTVVTGGALGVALAGAAIGAIGGAAGATISTVISNDWSNYGSNLFGGVVFGGISGFVGGTGIGLLGQIAINAGLGIANYAFSAAVSGDNITAGGLVFNGVLGGAMGWLGGGASVERAVNVSLFRTAGATNFFKVMVLEATVKGTLKSLGVTVGGWAADIAYTQLKKYLIKRVSCGAFRE